MATSVNVQLWIRFGDEYQHALSIPVHICHQFSLHPLTWLRFLGYAIHGKEGYISRERDGEQVADYRPDGAAISAGNYYYVSQDNGFCLLDPKGMDDRTSCTSNVTSRRANFARDVVNRDRCCVMTGTVQFEACHIIPHAKGDQVRSGPLYHSRRSFQTKYMKNFVAYREEDIEPRLESINDTRNGILLKRELHAPFGTSQVAFLQTPNFAMNVDDVPLVMQPQWVLDHLQFAEHPSVANSRLTFHNFTCNDYMVRHIVPHNSVAMQSNNDWPPRCLFDFAYGCAVLKTWGVREFVQFAEEKSKEFYYHDGDYDDGGDDDNDDDDSDNGRSVKGAGNGVRVHRNKTVRAKKADRRSWTETLEKAGDRKAVDIFDVVAGLWKHNAKKDMHQARMMEEEQTRESVQKWLQFVA
ncbi:hypothetical protein F5887DRAFT_1271369 [Amanita rubescens]|nr:hypothetical protein F5887DRAFT_1271369 [Amanita rubescens]